MANEKSSVMAESLRVLRSSCDVDVESAAMLTGVDVDVYLNWENPESDMAPSNKQYLTAVNAFPNYKKSVIASIGEQIESVSDLLSEKMDSQGHSEYTPTVGVFKSLASRLKLG